jgi:FKBP-type peptidyl-prolyl cis-trans isomerase FkpA
MRAAAICLAAAVALAACGRGDSRDGVPNPAAAGEAPGAGLRPPENPDPTANTYAPALGVDLKQFRKTASGLYVRDEKVGTGATAKAGDQVRVHYEGFLTDGKKFDGSRGGGDPYAFTIGQREVIKAWDEGIPGMRVGGTRTLVAPPELGYGATGAEPDIPANAVLVFKVELVGAR